MVIGPVPDFQAVFAASPAPCLLLAPDLTIVAASDAFLRIAMVKREEIIGRPMIEVFPDGDVQATGVRNLEASLRRVLTTGRPDVMPEQKYAIRRPQQEGGGFEERYWSPVNTPVPGSDGSVAWIIHQVEDVTDHIRAVRARGRAEEALVSATFERKVILDRLCEGFILMDRGFRVVEINREGLRLDGRGEAEIVGRTAWDLWPHVLGTGLEATVRRAMVERDPAMLDDLHVPPLGGRQAARIDIRVYPVDQGIVILFRDVTARKRIEDAIRKSEERLRRALETETVGVLFFDPAGTIKEANDAFLGFSGFTHEDVAAGRLRWQELTPPDHMEASWRAYTELTTSGRATPYEKEYYRKDGSRWWGLFAPRLLSSGEAVEFIIEISERKRTERQQAYRFMLNERLRDLSDPQEMIDTAIAALGGFLNVAQVGYSEADAPARHVRVLREWSDGRIPSVRGVWRMDNFGPAFIAEIKRGKTVAIADVRQDPRTRAPDVEALYRQVAIRSLLDVPLVKGGNLVALLFIHHPEPRSWPADEVALVEETCERLWAAVVRARAEAELRVAHERAEQARRVAEAADLSKSKFLAAASHDLRQPMQSLLLFLEVLRPHVGAGGNEALKHLGRGLDVLRQLLDSLLDMSRLDAGIVQPTIEDFPARDLFEQIGAAYVPIAQAKGLALEVAPCPAVIRSDRTLLGRMLRNLVENALRYTETGSITVECHEVEAHDGAGGGLRIDVRDTGIGIPADHLDRIWEEFHQVGNPERDRNRGLGLGLAIVQRLSRLLNHPVEVLSSTGRGSVFSILVPLGRLAPRPRVAPMPGMTGNGRFAVLIDDDAIVLLGLKAALESWGYDVLATGSAEHAVSGLRSSGREPVVVVADYRLREGRSGIDAILQLRAALGLDLPGVILTGETGPDIQAEAAGHGLHLIHKPVTASQLAEALERFQRDEEGGGAAGATA
ncbi:PAS domain-containing protein [Azospirillum picis]|uniref:histidine kinase n=1 Tax=Azospirillum picis TaxID=488438 RepID=A0ABU0MLI8_9PROT|nr:PAS domain-containing protein [Azospirillum picis]MBP2301053.1 PAS domain S-box-containing protein [Azospirillum picis]MDQ0534327.1 PAS domain S-box-containing protein [Azospirillum picis]